MSLLNLGDKDGSKKAFQGALVILETMSPESWGAAYPGNDPKIYYIGLSGMKKSITDNLKLLGIVDSGVFQ